MFRDVEEGNNWPSQSLFSSPVLLVSKFDGSRRMCIDYRELDARTIKDKFPIPVIEELLDELFWDKYFSKLDLNKGYYQVSMKEDDVEKTGFRTHHRHFEFLLHLRKFIFVFFDDILVYSRIWVEHMYHLRLVVNNKRVHLPKLKIAIFGHLINANGVSADSSKISAMTE
uniref:Reverse transcriptase domain-containing protein n=1 Tax=Solanum lycopersicum TaxID=4081 RepID=A0A3Q7G2S7_SOLLC